MKIAWTEPALADLVRLEEFLSQVSPSAAAKAVRSLVEAPDRLVGMPRVGQPLKAYAPREVRRLIVGRYEMRYEIAGDGLFILRVWHSRENRTP